jgi:hypothetical protein
MAFLFQKIPAGTLVISGKNDKLFIAVGAEAFKKDIKDAQISLLNFFIMNNFHCTR